MSATTMLEAAVHPADLIRKRVLRAFGSTAGRIAGDRELRVALIGSMVVLTSLATTLLAPLWSLALGPIVLGVPHLLADVRYLWVRPGLHRRLWAWIAIGGPLLAGLVCGRLVAGLLAAAGAIAIARTTPARRVIGFGVVGGLIAAAVLARGLGDLVFAHLHNFIAVALWWAWRPRKRTQHRLVLALFGLASAAVLTGALDGATRLWDALALPALGPPLSYHASILAPGTSAEVATRLVLLFAFAQSVHYGIWLRVIPEEDRPRPTPRTFAASVRQLVSELGIVPVALTGLLGVGLALWAVIDLASARSGYLRFATFHGQLELAAAALLLVERRSMVGPRPA